MDFEIFNDQFGAPKVTFSGVAKKIFDEKTAKYVHLSISDERDYAVAFVGWKYISSIGSYIAVAGLAVFFFNLILPISMTPLSVDFK